MLLEATQKGRTRLADYIMEFKRSGPAWKEIGSTLRGWAERGVPQHPQDATLIRLDRLKGWVAGSSRAVLEGGDPNPVEVPPANEVNDRAVALMRRVAALANEAAAILEGGGE